MGDSSLKKLVRELNQVCLKLHRDYHINYGGCCFIAYLLMKHFENLNIHPNLIIESEYEEVNRKEFLNCVHYRNNDNCNGLGDNTCRHYFIHIPKIGYVNSGYIEDSNLNKFKGLSSKDVKWIYKSGSWNKDYETKNNAMIGRKISQVFKKYEDLFKE